RAGRRDDISHTGLMAADDIHLALDYHCETGLADGVFCQMQTEDVAAFIINDGGWRVDVFWRAGFVGQQSGGKTDNPALAVGQRDHNSGPEHINRSITAQYAQA